MGVLLSEIPYTPLPGKIKTYFDKFQDAGKPDKVNRKWLNSLGFKSSNDYYIVKILKAMKFVDDSNVPTERWLRFKDPNKAPAIIAQGIKDAYSDLFKTYQDAYRKDREALYAYFSAKTGKSKRTVDLMVGTFVNLCKLADFETEITEAPRLEQVEAAKPVSSKMGVEVVSEKGIIPEVHVNVQLHLPATNDPTVYDNLFKSLKKHLLSGKE